MIVFISLFGGLTEICVTLMVTFATGRPSLGWLDLLRLFIETFAACVMLSLIDMRATGCFIYMMVWVIAFADNREQPEENKKKPRKTKTKTKKKEVKVDVMAVPKKRGLLECIFDVIVEIVTLAAILSPMFICMAYPVTSKTSPREDFSRMPFFTVFCLLWWLKTGEVCDALERI